MLAAMLPSMRFEGERVLWKGAAFKHSESCCCLIRMKRLKDDIYSWVHNSGALFQRGSLPTSSKRVGADVVLIWCWRLDHLGGP